MNNIQSRPSFTSTIIPKASMKNCGKFVDALESSFELKGLGASVENIRNQMTLGQAGFGFCKDGMVVVGKDKSADNFIFRTIKAIDKDVKFIDDAPEMKSDIPPIDFTAIG
ncbi:MAG: hypothetical protein K6E29_03610 [Cyanobacteria bacterium RUI128]|nr:hypothetical protein [Cyanobacteria bacterium RUI128]